MNQPLGDRAYIHGGLRTPEDNEQAYQERQAKRERFATHEESQPATNGCVDCGTMAGEACKCDGLRRYDNVTTPMA